MNDMQAYQHYFISSSQPKNYRTRSLVLDRPLAEARAGQFVMAWLPDVGEKPFSIADADPFKLTVADVGPFSEALCALKPGQPLWVRGPLGRGFELKGKRHILVGGGYGAAPLYFLAKQALARGDEVSVCLGARSQAELLLADDFRELDCRVEAATEDGSAGHQGLVLEAVRAALADFPAQTLYACGPKPMLLALAAYCKERKLAGQFSWEAMMRCGIGLCGSCEIDEPTCDAVGLTHGWLTCKDGPVSFYQPD
jgi:dihydroorotate dehydrogenase electron transfer subunit